MTPEDFNEAVGERIAELRQGAGLSQRALSDLSGVARGALRDIEAGTASPSVRTICRLAQALGLRPLELLPQDPPETLDDIAAAIESDARDLDNS